MNSSVGKNPKQMSVKTLHMTAKYTHAPTHQYCFFLPLLSDLLFMSCDEQNLVSPLCVNDLSVSRVQVRRRSHVSRLWVWPRLMNVSDGVGELTIHSWWIKGEVLLHPHQRDHISAYWKMDA